MKAAVSECGRRQRTTVPRRSRYRLPVPDVRDGGGPIDVGVTSAIAAAPHPRVGRRRAASTQATGGIDARQERLATGASSLTGHLVDGMMTYHRGRATWAGHIRREVVVRRTQQRRSGRVVAVVTPRNYCIFVGVL